MGKIPNVPDRIVGNMQIDGLMRLSDEYIIGVNLAHSYRIIIPSAVITSGLSRIIGHYNPSINIEVELTNPHITREQLKKLEENYDAMPAELVYVDMINKHYGGTPASNISGPKGPGEEVHFYGMPRGGKVTSTFDLNIPTAPLESMVTASEFNTVILKITSVR